MAHACGVPATRLATVALHVQEALVLAVNRAALRLRAGEPARERQEVQGRAHGLASGWSA